MAEPIKIRIQLKGDIAEIHLALNHPMETGQRKDPKTGRAIPANFIQTLAVTLNDKGVIDSQIGTAVSRNPTFDFKVKGAKPGDKIVVDWTDNKGDKRSAAATIT